MILISVIVPVYNCEKYLPNCIESIVSYEYDDLELIMIDDGSTDNSIDVINCYMKRDKRIKLICQNNSGPSMARNKGLEIAQGKYILFVDADDWLENGAISNFRELLLSKEYDTVIFSYKKIDLHFVIKGPKIFRDNFIYNDENKSILYEVIVASNKLNNVWGKFYSNKIIKENNITFDIRMKYAEDVVFNMIYFYYSKRGLYKECCFYNYRNNPTGLTKDLGIAKLKSMGKDIERLYNYTVDYMEKCNLSEKQKEQGYNKILKTALNLISKAMLNNITVDELKDIMSKPAFWKIISDTKAYGYKQKIKTMLLKFDCYKLYKGITRLSSKIKLKATK